MTAREMHYDFKQKLNKIDSQQNRNLVVPEIDWKLNEAQEVMVKIIAQPRIKNQLGFEVNQRTIDDIRTIVIDQKSADSVTAVQYDESSYLATLPDNYWFYVNSKIFATKGICSNKRLKARELQHDDEGELSPFDRSSFEWRVSNVRFIDEGFLMFTDGSFSIDTVRFQYLRQPRLIHNAQDFQGGTYNTMTGLALTGSSDCELPSGIHREIVDLAVLITAGDLNLPDYQLKQRKIQLTT